MGEKGKRQDPGGKDEALPRVNIEKDPVEDMIRKVESVSVRRTGVHAGLLQRIRDEPDEIRPAFKAEYELMLRQEYPPDGHIYPGIGGPNEAVVAPLYNAIGEVYPSLTREQRDSALAAMLDVMDRQNYAEVQIAHTRWIREPLLLADVCVARWVYWPGLESAVSILRAPSKRHPLEYRENAGGYLHIPERFTGFYLRDGDPQVVAYFKDEVIDQATGLFKREIVTSDFLMAYATLRTDYSSFGQEYVEYLEKANPKFLERVMKGIIATRFASAKTANAILQGFERLQAILPPSLHDRIDPLRLERDWTGMG